MLLFVTNDTPVKLAVFRTDTMFHRLLPSAGVIDVEDHPWRGRGQKVSRL